MPRRSSVHALPPSMRTALDKRLVDSGFSKYEELAHWITENHQSAAAPISLSALKRYGKKIERRMEMVEKASDQARAFARAGGDVGTIATGALQLVQERIFNLLLVADAGDMKELSATARALADAARATVVLRRDEREVRAEAAAAAEVVATKSGIGAETIRKMREAIEGR